LVVCFLGTYYPGRQDLSAVWKAVARIADDRSSPPVRLRIVGEVSPGMRAELRAEGLESLLDVTGFVTHEEALRRTASASILVAAGPARRHGPVGEGVIPAKLFEYLAVGLPILWVGVTPNDGASLLGAHPGCHVLEPDQVERAITAIRQESGRRYSRSLKGLALRDRAQALAKLLDHGCTLERRSQ
jgi:glycosyltransferase involved in cell wall biosynthesis